MRNFLALLIGIFLGIIFMKAEVLSWFRIQEMFAFQSFHMYGIIGSAIAVGCLLYTSPSPRDYAASRMPSSA